MDNIIRAVLRLQELETELTVSQYQLYILRLLLEILYYFDINVMRFLTIRITRPLNVTLRNNFRNLREDLEEILTWNEHEEEIYFRDD